MDAYFIIKKENTSKDLKNVIDAKLFIEYANNFKDYFYENKLKDKLNFLSFLLDEK